MPFDRIQAGPVDPMMTEHPMRICLWSGPRNVSTALMYSFAQRRDTEVVDEPLYSHFLTASGAGHPMRDICIAAQDPDGATVIRNVILGPSARPVLFFKQMAHHLVNLDLSFMRHTVNVFLTRDPEQMLPSLRQRIGQPTLRDTGYARQCEVLSMLEEWGQSPAVIVSRELLLDPRATLQELCMRLGIPFDRAMLRWPAGPKAFDGLWAPHWYRNVHRTTGFQPYHRKTEPFPEELRPLLEECQPYYETLASRSICPARSGHRV